MPLHEFEMLNTYGPAVVTGNAALFVGAGLSRPAGYPTWAELLARPAEEAGIPSTLTDLPLVAEYYIAEQPGGLERLRGHMLSELGPVIPTPQEGHRHIARLEISELWTSNYDPLVEHALPDAKVIVHDAQLGEHRTPGQRRLVKLHGSFTSTPSPQWDADPIITRSDYERYADTHPRMWAALTATFMTKSFLFLGFGFADPNIDVLLRLARTRLRQDGTGAAEHFTVMRRPDASAGHAARALYGHQVRDLERSGIGVVEISDYDELSPLLWRLVRRTRKPQLFVSGSGDSDGPLEDVAARLGVRLADLPGVQERIGIASMAGPAGLALSFAFGSELRAMAAYDPERVRFYFRRKDEQAPPLQRRIGVVVQTDEDEAALRRRLIDESRALIAIGGGDRTAKEIALAEELDVPVIPVACAGGAAAATWLRLRDGVRPVMLGGREPSLTDFELLGRDDVDVDTAVGAAVRLTRWAMYLDAESSHSPSTVEAWRP